MHHLFQLFICLYLLGWIYCCIKVDEIYFKYNKESIKLIRISLIHYVIFLFTWYIQFAQSISDYNLWEKKWLYHLQRLHQQITPLVKKAKMPALHAQDLQNCLCEFDKYERTRLGEGRPRSRYQGGA